MKISFARVRVFHHPREWFCLSILSTFQSIHGRHSGSKSFGHSIRADRKTPHEKPRSHNFSNKYSIWRALMRIYRQTRLHRRSARYIFVTNIGLDIKPRRSVFSVISFATHRMDCARTSKVSPPRLKSAPAMANAHRIYLTTEIVARLRWPCHWVWRRCKSKAYALCDIALHTDDVYSDWATMSWIASLFRVSLENTMWSGANK